MKLAKYLETSKKIEEVKGTIERYSVRLDKLDRAIDILDDENLKINRIIDDLCRVRNKLNTKIILLKLLETDLQKDLLNFELEQALEK